MHLYESEIDLPIDLGRPDIFAHLASSVTSKAAEDGIPIRFVITGAPPGPAARPGLHHCEVGFVAGLSATSYSPPDSIFRFRRRVCENQGRFTAAFLVPTGVGAEIGGHAGDAAPAAKTIAAVCDRLIVHPNVVNGADINEMSPNMLYVEGSVLTRLVMGTVGLAPVRSNRILTVIQPHDEDIIVQNAINAVNAAKASAGFSCTEVLALPGEMVMSTRYSSAGRATGAVARFDLLCDLIEARRASADAIAITTVINVDRDLHDRYFDAPGAPPRGGEADIVNPWGGIEALLTHGLSGLFDMPSAHSPMYEDVELMNSEAGIMDPRKAAEGVSVAFLHSVLKGLSASPRIVADAAAFAHHDVISAEDLSCLVVPVGCLGLPVLAALHQGIPVVEVRDNENRMRNTLGALPWAPGQHFEAGSYFEAAGMIAALRAGVAHDAVARPLRPARGSDMLEGRGDETPLARRAG